MPWDNLRNQFAGIKCNFHQIGDEDMSASAQSRISIDDVIEAAASGVLRALDARHQKQGGSRRVEEFDTNALVRAGFRVEIALRCGGWPLGPNTQMGPLEESGQLGH